MRNPGIDDYIRNVANFHLDAIEKVMDRDVLAFYGPIRAGVDHVVRVALEELENRRPRLALILDTSGGVAEVVERMVDVMRHLYTDVAVIVPDLAMSAGTILTMSADQIMMSYFSRLGPIDPQIVRDNQLIAGLSYLVQYQRLIEKDQGGELTSAEYALLSKMDLAELHMIEQARDLSITLLKKWLAQYKFKDWSVTRDRKLPVDDAMRTKRAEEIAQRLSQNTYWLSHGRGISRKTLEEDLNLIIDHLEDHPELDRAVSAYHAFVVELMRQKGFETFGHTRAFY